MMDRKVQPKTAAIVTGKRKKKFTPYWFIIPAVFATLFVHILPILSGVLLSFFDLTNLRNWTSAPFVGFQNFTIDADFWNALYNIVFFCLIVVPMQMVIGFFVALLLNNNFKGRTFVRGFVLLPYILPDSMVYNVWRFIFQERTGLINKYLLSLGLLKEPMSWLIGPMTMGAVIIANIWKGWPFACLMFLAGLQTIPIEIYEAAMIDGANAWQRLRYITVPLLSSIAKTLAVMLFLWGINSFNQFYTMFTEIPGKYADIPSILIYRTSFRNLRYGQGAAMSLIFIGFILLLTVAYVLITKFNNQAEDME